MTNTNFNQSLADLVEWVTSRDGDVDFGSFRDACDEIAIRTFQHLRIRIPAAVLGRGVCTLDMACALNNTWLPSEFLAYHLPGMSEFRAEFPPEDLD